jgi:protein-S-isoprenylcysteine O-methyltransferase Ste14
VAPDAHELLWLLLTLVAIAVRRVHERRSGRPRTLAGIPPDELVLMVLWGLAAAVLPLFFVFGDALAFADYPFALPPLLRYLGVALFLVAIWLLHRSHVDLGAAWTLSLEPVEDARLVTDGVYRSLRHPMYAAHLLWGLAQALLLGNALAGPPALLLMLVIAARRIPREEAALEARYGDAWRSWAAVTPRLIPRPGS